MHCTAQPGWRYSDVITDDGNILSMACQSPAQAAIDVAGKAAVFFCGDDFAKAEVGPNQVDGIVGGGVVGQDGEPIWIIGGGQARHVALEEIGSVAIGYDNGSQRMFCRL